MHENTKALYVAWRPEQASRGWRPVGRLMRATEDEGGLYQFCYTHGAKQPGFQPFVGMPDLNQVYTSDELFPLFKNRLLAERRPEYQDYLRWSGFDPNDPPEPIVLLGVTEGIRKTDAVEVFPYPRPDGDGCYLNRFFLHGVRWFGQQAADRINRITPGERLCLMFDVQNEYDPYAIALRTTDDRTIIGYVPRYLTHDVWKLSNQCDGGSVEIVADQVNHNAPTQNRLLCRMHACWPPGFLPCDGDEFKPIPANAPADCQPAG